MDAIQDKLSAIPVSNRMVAAAGVTSLVAYVMYKKPVSMSLALYLLRNKFARKAFLHLSTIAAFGGVYAFLDEDDFVYPGHTNTDHWVRNSFYYSAVTHTTLGFGEIVPKSDAARVATVVHALMVLLLLST